MEKQGVCSGAAAASHLVSVCGIPRDGEGCSQTLHRNYLLSNSNNLGQAEEENMAEEVALKMIPLQSHKHIVSYQLMA